MPLLSDSLRNFASSLTITALIIAALVLGSEVLIPLTLAVMITFVLTPVVRALMKWRFPKPAAVMTTVAVVTAILVAMSGLISNELLGLTSEIGNYKSNVIAKVRAVTGSDSTGGVLSRASAAVESLGADLQKEFSDKSGKDATTAPLSQVGAPPPTVIVAPSSSLTNPAIELLSSFGKPAAQTALTFLFVVFLLMQYQDLRDRVVRVVGTDRMSDTTSAMSEAGSRLSRLFLMQALLNGSFGIFVGLALWVIGVPNAALWALLAAIMRFVPFIGSFIAAIPPIFLAAAVDPGWSMFFATAAVFVIGEPVMGHVIEPLLLGKRAGISPFAMVASASFWTLIWGPVGLLLAAPLTMAMIVLGRYIDGLQFFSVLLGDDPPLSREQEFYHRLLSEDPISAVDSFETAVEEQSVSSAIDNLVLPALNLAAYDQRLGRLDKVQLENISKTMTALRDNLPPLQPSSREKSSAPILVMSARGAIDLAAASFAATALSASTDRPVQLASEASGLTALAAAHEQMKNKEVHAILIVTVGGADASQLRFIAKRADRDFPGVQIFVLEFRSESDVRPAVRAIADHMPVSRRLGDIIGQLRNGNAVRGPSTKSCTDGDAIELLRKGRSAPVGA